MVSNTRTNEVLRTQCDNALVEERIRSIVLPQQDRRTIFEKGAVALTRGFLVLQILVVMLFSMLGVLLDLR